MKRTPLSRTVPMPPRTKPLRAAGFIPIVYTGGAHTAPPRPEDTIPANTRRLVDAILHDATQPKRRAPLAKVSKKRARQNRERSAMADRRWPDRREGTVMCVVPDCGRPADDLNETLPRARGGSITDEANTQPTCRRHNGELTLEPAWGYDAGLLRHSWDGPPPGDAA